MPLDYLSYEQKQSVYSKKNVQPSEIVGEKSQKNVVVH